MAKSYDFKSAKKYIQMHSDVLKEVSLGMKEDWFWTAETVFEYPSFTKNLDEPDMSIGGINSSSWATPVMQLIFADGTEVFKDCYVGESNEQKPEWFTLGCLSKPVQDRIENKQLKLEDKSNG